MNEVMSRAERLGQVPEFLYVLDLDRTLVDSELGFEVLCDVVKSSHGIDLQQRHEEIKKSGGSFDVVGELKKYVSEDDLDSIREKFLEGMAERDDYFHEGAQELLDHLESQHMPYIITTLGGDEWQEWKLAAAKLLDKDYLITQTEKKKGDWIAREWKLEDGSYAPPLEDKEQRQRLRAKHIVLVDDKRESLEGLPEDSGNVRVLVRHSGFRLLPSQEAGGYEPDMIVTGLRDLPDLIEIKLRGKEERKAT